MDIWSCLLAFMLLTFLHRWKGFGGKLCLKKGNTHGDPFHADDVCVTALLRIVFPDLEVECVGDFSSDVNNAIVYDIGYGRYDHH